jgi:DNA repair photolyase
MREGTSESQFNIQEHGCPVGCEYCVITKVESRRELWNEKTILGINKAVTILNPPPDLKNEQAVREFYNFPVELLRGDFVGFNAISDPFWPKYKKELDFFLEKVAPVAKLITCVTKFNPPDAMLERLAEIPNFRLVVSITGLDSVERTKTRQRLNLLERAKQKNVQAFPIIHPYIAGMSDLSFLPRLKELGYGEVDVKGLRYSPETMASWMPDSSKFYYEGTDEQEVLPEDGWRDRVKVAGLQLTSLKSWYQRGFENMTPKLSQEEAEKEVGEILKRANITSSDTDKSVVEAAIKRRM